MNATATHTIRVECSCKACRTYAATNGLPFPMAALAQPAAAERLDARTLVHTAYDKVAAFAAVRPSIPA